MIVLPVIKGIDKPKVSIIIISYNQENYIDDAIRSAVSQDYCNLEVVVSDDASSDGTAEIISRWKELYPDRIVSILNKVNSGITGNCNIALNACSGEYIALQGGDDILLPGKIAAQIDWFSQDENRVLCGHHVEVFYDDNSNKPHLDNIYIKHGEGPEWLIRKGVPYCGTAIMVKADKIPVHGFDESVPFASDLIFYIEILMGGGEYGAIDGVYARYRRHASNITNRSQKMLEDLKKTYEILAVRYPRYRNLCKNMLVEHYLYYSGVLHLKSGNKKEARINFLRALKKRPFFLKTWIRLLQAI